MKAGWHTKQLGDICRLIGGGTPSKGKMEYYAGNIPWATVRDMRSEVITETECKITKEAVKSSATNVIPMGNIVIATRVGLGKVCLLGQDTAINQDLRGIVPIDPKILSVRFLFWWLISITDSIVAEGTGATVQGVKLPFVRSLQAPVPPLAEQRRIVGILDEAFEGIATAKANAEKNLQNARAVFESHLNAVFTQRGEGWVEKRLAEICVLQRGFDLPTRSRVPGDFPLVSSSGVIDSHNEGPVSGPGVATGRSGSIGNVFYIEDDYWPLNTVLYVKEFHGNYPKFVYRLLSHFDLRRFATGAGVPTLNRNFVHDERVVVPESKTVQKKIAEQFDGIEQETRCLESIYRQKLSALEELKKSLLHQAFVGGL